MPFSWLDVILVIIMLVSGFLAMVRGFTREVLSIFSWAMAAVAALYLTPRYSSVLSPYIDNPTVAMIAFAAGVFLITLIVVSLITFRISDRVLDSRVGALDRTFGFLFGLARGFLLVAIVFILFSALARDQPAWILEARSYPILKQTQVAIEILDSGQPRAVSPDQAGEARSSARDPRRPAGLPVRRGAGDDPAGPALGRGKVLEFRCAWGDIK